MKHDFYDLFEPIKHDRVKLLVSKKPPLLLRRSIKKNFHIPFIIRKTLSYTTFERTENERLTKYNYPQKNGKRKVVIRSFARFYENPKMYQLFVPVKSVRDRIDSRSSAFDENTVGVHIRRTDNVKAKNVSPNHLFVEVMKKEIELEPKANFYLATDCDETKAHFKSIFGEKIITAKETATRSDVEGIRDAMVELYSLSRTKKIYGSYWSSFSHTAAHIGGIPEITVSINQN